MAADEKRNGKKTDASLIFPNIFKILQIVHQGPENDGLVAQPGRLLVCLLAGYLAEELLFYRIGLIPSRFYPIIEGIAQDGRLSQEFMQTVGELAGLIGAVGILGWFVGWCREMYILLLRKVISDRWIYNYTSSLDNLDQRLCQDVCEFGGLLAPLLRTVLLGPVLLIFYTHQCWERMQWWGVAAIYGYFLLGLGLLGVLSGGPIRRLTVERDREEGLWRHVNAEASRLSESIQMSEMEEIWMARVHRPALTRLLRLQHRQILWDASLGLIKRVLGYLGAMLNYILVGLAFACGALTDQQQQHRGAARLLSETSFVALYLIGILTELSSASDRLAKLGGHAERITAMLRNAKSHKSLESIVILGDSKVQTCSIHFDQISLACPKGGGFLFKDFNLFLTPGVHWHITGPSGSGKTSILRLLCGIWRPQQGRITIKRGHRPFLMILPEEPVLLPSQTMLEQIVPEGDQARIEEICRFLKLEPLSSTEGLSPGQIQRIMLARLIYAAPQFAFLDESTNSVESDLEAAIFDRLASSGTTVILISHRTYDYASPRCIFKHVCRLHGDEKDNNNKGYTIIDDFP